MKLTDRELRAILAGLRAYQFRLRHVYQADVDDIDAIADDNGRLLPLNVKEIDELCKQLTTEEKD